MSNFVSVDYDTIHQIVEKNKNLFWNGWQVVEWRKDPDAFFKKTGLYRNGSWGNVVRRINVDTDGTWKVPTKYELAR